MNPPKPPLNPWPIAIVSYFVVFATFIGLFITWSVRQKQDLVAENYYEHEVRFQQQLDRAQRTQAQVPGTTVIFDAQARNIRVELPGVPTGSSGQIHLYRPSNAQLDQKLPLALDGAGLQKLDATALAPGLWKVRVEWKAHDQDFYIDQSVVVTAIGVPTKPTAS